MSVVKVLAKCKKLPFNERVELAHRLWDEFMDGFQGWNAQPVPRKASPWKALKAEIDSTLTRSQRIELAQRVWQNIIENGYDPEPTPEQVEELERRAAEMREHPERAIPWEKVRAEGRRKIARK